MAKLEVPGFIDSAVRRDGHLGFELASRLKKALGEQQVVISDFNPPPEGRYKDLILIYGSVKAREAYQEIMETPAVRGLNRLRNNILSRKDTSKVFSKKFYDNILDVAVVAYLQKTN